MIKLKIKTAFMLGINPVKPAPSHKALPIESNR